MTKNFIKRYSITLKTIGPVFIGSGEKLTSKEYIYNPIEKKIIVVDKKKLMDEVLKSDRLEEFVEYFNGTNTRGVGQNKQVRLLGWPLERGLKDKISSIEYHSYDASHLPKNVNDIELFIKDPLTGKPYIPGSSIKGMLTTIMLKSQNTAYDTENSFKEKEDIVKAIMKCIKVSDSDLISKDKLCIVQKIDRNKKGVKFDTEMVLFRECICPDTDIKFDITLSDINLSKDEKENLEKYGNAKTQKNGYDLACGFIEELKSKSSKVYKEYINAYTSKFELNGKQRTKLEDGKIYPCAYLGGGVGFRSKTVVKDEKKIKKILEPKLPRGGKFKAEDLAPLRLKITKLNTRTNSEKWLEINEDTQYAKAYKKLYINGSTSDRIPEYEFGKLQIVSVEQSATNTTEIK